jgi:FKBP-type peptidyl-prolyl cis-trans isomerase FklB
MRIEMKLIPSAFVTVILLAFNASAQPSSPSPAAPRMPPGLAQRMPPGHPPVEPAGPPPPLPDKDKLSYAIGYGIGTSIKRDLFEVDVDSLAAAMKDVLADRPTRLSQKEVDDVMAQFRKALPAYMASQNKLKGEQFLAQNAKAPGITVLSNGLQYKVLKEGSGEMPKTNDTVVVNYKGTLIDGTVFDQRDGFTNRVTGQTIKGWSEILPLMKTGSKWQVTIPSELGYGARGPQKIGPNAVLVFDMELVSILPPSAVPAPTPVVNQPPVPASHPMPPAPPAANANTTPVVSGQIIKVPSAEELKKGAKIEVITNAPNP